MIYSIARLNILAILSI